MSNDTQGLNTCQLNAYNTICEFLNTPYDTSNRIMLLSGSAGTGKTFLTNHIVKYALGLDLNLLLCAPTHKAKRVLIDNNPERNVVTNARLLGVRRGFNEDSGKYCNVKDESIAGDINSLIIVDESSMIDDEMYGYFMSNTVGKILFIGDKLQLFPVKQSYCSVYNKSSPEVNLTEVVRQAKDNPIIQISQIFKSHIENNTLCDLPCNINAREFLDNYDTQGDVILAYTNKKVKEYNHYIRVNKLGLSTDYIIGEPMISNDTYTKMNMTIVENNDDLTIDSVSRENYQGISCQRLHIINNDVDNEGIPEEKVLKIKAFEATQYFKNTGLGDDRRREAWVIFYTYCNDNAIEPDGVTTDIKLSEFDVLIPDDEELAQRLTDDKLFKANRYQALYVAKVNDHIPIQSYVSQRKRNREYALVHPDGEAQRRNIWSEYYTVRNLFLDIRPPYACTVHKSQGSTYCNVFIDMDDIKHASNKMRLMYVAITRCSNTVALKGNLL